MVARYQRQFDELMREPEHLALGLSIVFHTILFASLLISKAPVRPVIETVEVSYATPPPPQKRVRTPVTQQIVRQETPLNNEKSKTEFLSAHDQKVEQETQAKNGKFNNEKAKGEKKAKSDDEPLPDLSQAFAVKETGDNGKKKNGDEMATDDYLKNVEQGMETVLNTRQFAYYDYYAKIKERIGQYWEPGIREKVEVIYKEGRTIASEEDMTELAIVLDGDGNLLRVDVIRRSGNPEFDEMAIKAFRSAAPFPKPPKGLVDSNGQIKIRYDFIIQT